MTYDEALEFVGGFGKL
jgi:MFS family permease